jgi:glyoxylase-like metal-dependent hydrolase (beta-lactamase superfamily II)
VNIRVSRLRAGLGLAVIALVLGLAGCEKKSGAALTIQVYSAPEAAATVNSVLIAGSKEAILVDTQMVKAEAEKVVEMVKQSGKTLTTVLISHPHPDHLLGAAVIQAAFPEAKFVSSAKVAAAIEGSGARS